MYSDFHFRYVRPTNKMAAVTLCRRAYVRTRVWRCVSVSACVDKTEINSIFTYCYRITDLISNHMLHFAT